MNMDFFRVNSCAFAVNRCFPLHPSVCICVHLRLNLFFVSVGGPSSRASAVLFYSLLPLAVSMVLSCHGVAIQYDEFPLERVTALRATESTTLRSSNPLLRSETKAAAAGWARS